MGARILVADDSVTIQKVVELTFSKEDFVLVQARSGEEAIRKAKEARPDLVLLDLVMPDKNGYEVCAALRAEPTLRAVPIILLPGTFETFDREQGLRAGADDFVTKPFESQALISKVKQLLFARMMEKGTLAPASPGSTAAPISVPLPAAREETPPRAATPGESLPSSVEPKSKTPEPGLDFPRPAEETSQDRLWQLLDAAPAAPPSGAAAPELSLEALTEPPTPSGAEEAQADIPLLELDAVGPSVGEGQVAGAAPGAGALPESLSLEELLQTPAPAPVADVAPLVEGDTAAPPVFDLSVHMETPPLPMREMAEADAAGGSSTELMSERALAGADVAPPVPPAEPDLVPHSGAVSGEAIPSDDLPPAEPFIAAPEGLGASVEIPLTREEMAVIEAGETGSIETSPAPAVEPSTEVEEFPLWAAGATAPPIVDAAQLVSFQDLQPFPAPPAAAGLAEVDLATMRDAVTERVAHELARDLTEKLVERIERIVWEVVPDLAEILITKEIERIRAMAQEKKSS